MFNLAQYEMIKAPKENSYINATSVDHVYEFLFCPCIYESAWGTVSLHKTLRGAYSAMKKHRLDTFEEWRNYPNEYRKDFKDTFAKDWTIRKKAILP